MDFGDNETMRMFLFWFAVLGPKARVVFLAACGVLLYASLPLITTLLAVGLRRTTRGP